MCTQNWITVKIHCPSTKEPHIQYI